jgi:hypothetical protein
MSAEKKNRWQASISYCSHFSKLTGFSFMFSCAIPCGMQQHVLGKTPRKEIGNCVENGFVLRLHTHTALWNDFGWWSFITIYSCRCRCCFLKLSAEEMIWDFKKLKAWCDDAYWLNIMMGYLVAISSYFQLPYISIKMSYLSQKCWTILIIFVIRTRSFSKILRNEHSFGGKHEVSKFPR